MVQQIFLNEPSDPTSGTNVRPVQERSSAVFFEDAAKELIEAGRDVYASQKAENVFEDIEKQEQQYTNQKTALMEARAERQREVLPERIRNADDINNLIKGQEDDVIRTYTDLLNRMDSGEVQGALSPERARVEKMAAAKTLANQYPFAREKIQSMFERSTGGVASSDISTEQKRVDKIEEELDKIIFKFTGRPEDVRDPVVREMFKEGLSDQTTSMILRQGDQTRFTLSEQSNLANKEVSSFINSTVASLSQYKGGVPPEVLARIESQAQLYKSQKSAYYSNLLSDYFMNSAEIDTVVDRQITKPIDGLLEMLKNQGADVIGKRTVDMLKYNRERGMFQDSSVYFAMYSAFGDQAESIMKQADEFASLVFTVDKSGKRIVDEGRLSIESQRQPAKYEAFVEFMRVKEPKFLTELAMKTNTPEEAEDYYNNNPVGQAFLAGFGPHIKNGAPNDPKAVKSTQLLSHGAVSAMSKDDSAYTWQKVLSNPNLTAAVNNSKKDFATDISSKTIYGPNGIIERLKSEAPDGARFEIRKDIPDFPPVIIATNSNGDFLGATLAGDVKTNYLSRSGANLNYEIGQMVNSGRVRGINPTDPNKYLSANLLKIITSQVTAYNRFKLDGTRVPATADEFLSSLDFKSSRESSAAEEAKKEIESMTEDQKLIDAVKKLSPEQRAALLKE